MSAAQQSLLSFDFCRPLSSSSSSTWARRCPCCGGGGRTAIELSCMHVVCAACVNKARGSLLLLDKVQSSVRSVIFGFEIEDLSTNLYVDQNFVGLTLTRFTIIISAEHPRSWTSPSSDAFCVRSVTRRRRSAATLSQTDVFSRGIPSKGHYRNCARAQ